MIELQGKYNTAKVFTDNVEGEAISQIINLLNQEFVQGSKIRIMPDTHAGAGCTIGTTMTITDKIVPNLVGVDIGCGMETAILENNHVELQRLDKVIHANIPAGFDVRTVPHPYVSELGLETLRKGAISAQVGERVLIPINMRDGSLVCVGKGNPDWNYSAPHGIGWQIGRSAAKTSITLSKFEKSMEGIYSSTINKSTIDESPMAYKPMDEIVANIGDTVDITAIIKPLYNFKAAE